MCTYLLIKSALLTNIWLFCIQAKIQIFITMFHLIFWDNSTCLSHLILCPSTILFYLQFLSPLTLSFSTNIIRCPLKKTKHLLILLPSTTSAPPLLPALSHFLKRNYYVFSVSYYIHWINPWQGHSTHNICLALLLPLPLIAASPQFSSFSSSLPHLLVAPSPEMLSWLLWCLIHLGSPSLSSYSSLSALPRYIPNINISQFSIF